MNRVHSLLLLLAGVLLASCRVNQSPALLTPGTPEAHTHGAAIIGWSGLYQVDGSEINYFAKAYGTPNVATASAHVTENFEKIRQAFSQLTFTYPAELLLPPLSVEQARRAKAAQEEGRYYILVLVPNLEVFITKEFDTRIAHTYTHVFYAGMSAILVQPGTGRISAVGQGVKSASLSLEYLLQEQDIATAFGNLYQQAALLAMERLQGRPLSREGIPQLMTNVAISAADLRTLFDISGDTELTERNCQSSACRTLANLLGQLGTEYLAQHQHFALPPLMGTMSPRGSKWGNHASMQTVNLIGIRLADPRALDRYAININPARVQQHIALELPEAEAHNVSRYPQVQQWEFKVQGHLLTCANRIPQLSSEAFAQLENRQSKLCAAEYRQGRGLAFDNNHTPASYKGLSAPDDDIRRDAFIGAIYNAFYPEKR